jgi:hypothetical protein
MQRSAQHWRSKVALLVIVAGLFFLLVTMAPAQAQTFTVLHTFTGSPGDGAHPFDGVVVDRGGNLYGTAPSGGTGLWLRSGVGAHASGESIAPMKEAS